MGKSSLSNVDGIFELAFNFSCNLIMAIQSFLSSVSLCFVAR